MAHVALGIPLAARALYPFTIQLLLPMVAALAMSLSSVPVITNALRPRTGSAPGPLPTWVKYEQTGTPTQLPGELSLFRAIARL